MLVTEPKPVSTRFLAVDHIFDWYRCRTWYFLQVTWLLLTSIWNSSWWKVNLNRKIFIPMIFLLRMSKLKRFVFFCFFYQNAPSCVFWCVSIQEFWLYQPADGNFFLWRNGFRTATGCHLFTLVGILENIGKYALLFFGDKKLRKNGFWYKLKIGGANKKGRLQAAQRVLYERVLVIRLVACWLAALSTAFAK